MVREIEASDCAVKWDLEALARANIDLSPEPTASELDLDETDTVQPLHDALVTTKLWWILEILPLSTTWQDANGVWHTNRGYVLRLSCIECRLGVDANRACITSRFHLGKGRKIVDPQPNFHLSVQKRMASPLKYSPKAQWTAGTEVYLH